MIIPERGLGCRAFRSFRKIAKIATAKNGTVPIKRAINPEEMCFPASVTKNQGTTISTAPNTNTYGQAFRAGLSPPMRAAYGIRNMTPSKVLRKTMEGVEKLSRAMTIKKYGRPQIKPTRAKRIRPFRVTTQ
jgi:hypothetical protein